MPPDEPTDEERLEELPEDNGTPFTFAPEEERDPDAEPDDLRQVEETLDPTHPATDSGLEMAEAYDEGLAGAAEASEPNAGDTVEDYTPPAGQGATVQLAGDGQQFPGYLARPWGEPKGAVVVVHEVWGLTDHIKSVADRFAAAGYLALAPNLLSETDIEAHVGTLNVDLFNPEKRNEAQPKLRALMAPTQEPGFAGKTIAKLRACVDYLTAQPQITGRIAACGFCFGGSYVYTLAVHEPRLRAAVAFYGHAPADPAELHKIACPVLAFYGQYDEGLMSGLPELKKAMKAAGIAYKAVVYPGCGHAFFNDANPYAYNQAAATGAWRRTLSFLNQHLA